MGCAGLTIAVIGFIYRLVWVFIWSDCLDCVPVFLLISFWFLFVYGWYLECVLSCYGCGGEWGKTEEEKDYCYYYFSLPYRVSGLCAGRNGGGRIFVCGACAVCVGRLVRGALCVVVLSLGCFVAFLRVFLFRQGVYMSFPRKCLRMDFWRPLPFSAVFIGFAYLPHILSLCLGWGRRMFYIRTHAEGDTHIEDVRFVRGGV